MDEMESMEAACRTPLQASGGVALQPSPSSGARMASGLHHVLVGRLSLAVPHVMDVPAQASNMQGWQLGTAAL